MDSVEKKVRLVMCPNCENVLPELPDYSVYQCGGCGAVLCAKGKFQEDDGGAVGETLDRRSGHSAVPLGVLAAQDIDPGISSSSLNQRRSDKSGRDARPGIVETNVRSGKAVGEDVHNASFPGISLDEEDCGFRSRAGGMSELQKSKPVSGWQKSGAVNGVGFLKNGDSESHAVRYSASKNPDEGPSDFNSASTYTNPEGVLGNPVVTGYGDRVRLLERDRKELLIKLDELKNQLSQSYVVGPTGEGLPVSRSTVRRDAFGNHNPHSPGSSVGRSKMLQQEHSDANRHSAGLPYFGQYPSSLNCTNGPDAMYNQDSALRNSNHYPGLCDHYSTQMCRSCTGQLDCVPPHSLISGQYLGDPFGPVPASLVPCQPTCSCFHRMNNHREASAPAPPVAFCKGRPNVSPSKSLHFFGNAGAFGCSYVCPRQAVPSCNTHLQCPHIGPHSKLNPAGYMHRRPQRVMSFGGGRRSQPIAGGAAFLACGSCLELLQIPMSVLKANDGGKFRCGACNTVINYDIVNQKLMFSTLAEAKRVTSEDKVSSCGVMNGSTIQSRRYVTGASYRFSSDEFDDLGYDYLSSERARATSSSFVNLSLTNSQEMESISPSLSNKGNSPSGLVNSGDSVQQAANVSHSTLPPGSPLRELFDHSRDHSSNRFGRGNRSSRSDHEVLSNKTIVRQNSLHESSLPTEVEMSFHESSENAVPGDSGDANREHDHPKGNKGESFLSNIFKKSFKDLTPPGQGDEHGQGKVFVNGHLIPDRSTKKAEKLAGRILSGKYWYDFRAGFWGVMNGPCLGIIPPYIKEFNYPMMENCAGGDTGVFVNGRELHHQDLDLLASRGLPLDRDRSYNIEISGRVYDEDTGEELDCLGKLAPTVEKVKRGFGMRAPKAVNT